MSTAIALQQRHPHAQRRRRHLLAATLAAASAVLLQACTTTAALDVNLPVERIPHAAFLLEGRMSASDGQQGASGRIEWQHHRDQDSWTLLSPLGQIAAQLDSSPDGAVLQLADGRRLVASTADQLLPRLLGIDVPVQRLSKWVQAAPDTQTAVRAHDASGRPLTLIDQGWRIDYLAYADDTPQALPVRLDISRGDANIRLIIDSWTTQP